MKSYPPITCLAGGAQILAALLFFFCFFSAPYVVFAADTPIAELMEQGVYSEETKGDLDAAMLLYQQVITKADAGQALAAQAQFRLASCLDKKKDHVQALAAFAKLVHDYPSQKELVARANEHLAVGVDLLPVPWVDGEEMWFNVNLQSGFKVGVARLAVKADRLDGHNIWRLDSHLSAGGMQQWSRLEVEADSFKPINCRWKHSMAGEADTAYTPGLATVKVKPLEFDAVRHYELSGAVYDNEQALQLMRRLPLTVGSSTAVQLFVGLGGGSVLPFQLTGETIEPVKVPAGTFDCLRVGTNIHQTFWYSTDAHHYLVKFEAGGIVAELTAVKKHTESASERYVDAARGFSVTVPAEWMSNLKEGPDQAKRSELMLFDAEDISLTMVKVENLKNFDQQAQATVRSYAEHQLSEWKKYGKDFTVRADSWKETTIAGQPAVSVVTDFTQGKDRKAGRGVYAFVDGMAVDISTVTAPEDFEAFQPKFDAVVASYQGK